ncbi:phage tail protein [Pedobacter yulinensis]|uniref:Phage tail protein n=1 Tax=Pedobacter yulinensis TaxID=2126353 RepID=A0A2T3HHI3_9SPHI|nr:tail fiber protein [Pedobacter yulinensis]PST81841.1 phage tail protein [Pedobacter yulinensis]
MTEPYLGSIVLWAPNFAPRGWAYCLGQTLAISSNTALFSLLGTTYGGNGQTTFMLPNFGGRVPVGAGQSPGTSNYTLGQVSGTENVTITLAQMPMHTHVASGTLNGNVSLAASAAQAQSHTPSTANNVLASPYDPNAASDVNGYISQAAGGTLVPLAGGSLSGNVAITVGVAGGSMPLPIMQPYLAINYIIALEGVFPSRN